jgi:hypothetical protein
MNIMQFDMSYISSLMHRNLEFLNSDDLYDNYFSEIKYCFLELKIFSNIYTHIVHFYNDNSWEKNTKSISIIHKIDLCIIKILQIFCLFLETVNNKLDITDLILSITNVNYNNDFKDIKLNLYRTKNTLKQLVDNLELSIKLNNPNYILNIPIHFTKSTNYHSSFGKINHLKNDVFSMKGLNIPELWNIITGDEDNKIYLNILKSRRYTIQFPIYDENNIFGWFKQMFNKINLFYILTKTDNILFLQCLYSKNLYKTTKIVSNNEELININEDNCIIININNYKLYLQSFFMKLYSCEVNDKINNILSQFDKLICNLIIESNNEIKQYKLHNRKNKGFKLVNKKTMFFYEAKSMSSFVPLSEFYKNKYEILYIYFCNLCNKYQPYKKGTRIFCCLYCSVNNCTFCNIQYDLDTTHICSDNTVEGCKKCPQCGINTFKEEGCDKILCSRCKCAWCYMCAEKTIFQLSDIDTIMQNNGAITNVNSLLYLHYSNNCTSIKENNQFWYTDINQFYIISDLYESPLSEEQKNKFIKLFNNRIQNI